MATLTRPMITQPRYDTQHTTKMVNERDLRASPAARRNTRGRPWTAWTLWPSGLRRWLKAPFRKGVGSNPTGVILTKVASQAIAA